MPDAPTFTFSCVDKAFIPCWDVNWSFDLQRFRKWS